MYAVVETGGKQYRVVPGQIIDVESLDFAEGETVNPLRNIQTIKP